MWELMSALVIRKVYGQTGHTVIAGVGHSSHSTAYTFFYCRESRNKHNSEGKCTSTFKSGTFFFFTWFPVSGFPGNCAFYSANRSEGTVWHGVIGAIWVFSFNTQYRASSNGCLCPLHLSYHLDLCSCVCSWLNR